ncbi:VanZ family protein [Shouchella sp. JSM 1781072]|uniref:VanZ family protein n=1 Tax=Bacillaceae TaxID=186817 RepID=UPI0020D1B594|nr:VanZ family protein [Alkalihalobacillus sp. LMS6]UTR06732.1 VanZ family protein [Alkalihalobacillus sp. LMS6]
MLRFNLSPIFLSIIIFIVLFIYLRKKRNKDLTYMAFWTLFYIYIVNVIRLTQFPVFIVDFPFEYNLQDFIQLKPESPLGYNLETSLLNVLLTIPFGFGLAFLIKMNFKKALFLTVCFSLTLEILQLSAHLFLPGNDRMVDVNDVIYNTLGGIIGYLLFLLFGLIFKLILSKYELEDNSILDHIRSSVNTNYK